MSKNLKRSLLIGAAVVAIILTAKSCGGDLCSKCESNSDLISMEHKIQSDRSGFISFNQNSLFVQTPNGKLSPLDKRKELDPLCFSEDDYLDELLYSVEEADLGETTPISLEAVLPLKEAERNLRDYPSGYPSDYVNSSNPNLKANGNIWAVDLTWSNTTIVLVNFDKDGRLESRELKPIGGTKSGTVRSDIDKIMQRSSGTPVNEYKAVQYFLTNLVHGSNPPGRPPAEDIAVQGFEVRDLGAEGVPPSKTPFYRKFEFSSGYSTPGKIDYREGHVFFYVLLDNHLRFQRDTAATIPYTPNSAKPLYSPYVQYPIVPSKDLRKSQPEKVDVMTVHFFQGGEMTKGMGDNPQCSYPYDIGVVAAGQNGWKNETPLMIDPETDTGGVLPP